MKYTSRGYKVFQVFNYTFMILVILTCLFPYLHVLAKSLNDSVDTMTGGLTIFPREVTLENYKILFKDKTIYPALNISLYSVVFGTLIALTVQFSAAYALRRKKLVGRSAILTFLIIPMFISGGLIPTYILYSKAGLINNLLVYIIPGCFSFYNMIIIRTYMNSAISDSIEESARIDGANEIIIFFRIILPLSKPILATITLWHAVGEWNNWTTTLYFITKSQFQNLQYKLMQIIRESERIAQLMQQLAMEGKDVSDLLNTISPESLIAAQIIFTTIPIILVYPFLQKYFVQGVMIGAIKE